MALLVRCEACCKARFVRGLKGHTRDGRRPWFGDPCTLHGVCGSRRAWRFRSGSWLSQVAVCSQAKARQGRQRYGFGRLRRVDNALPARRTESDFIAFYPEPTEASKRVVKHVSSSKKARRDSNPRRDHRRDPPSHRCSRRRYEKQSLHRACLASASRVLPQGGLERVGLAPQEPNPSADTEARGPGRERACEPRVGFDKKKLARGEASVTSRRSR